MTQRKNKKHNNKILT